MPTLATKNAIAVNGLLVVLRLLVGDTKHLASEELDAS